MRRITLALLLSLAVGAAHAQLGLPGVRVAVPVPPLPAIGRTLQGIDPQVDTNTLQDARSVQVRNLIRRNRATLEADPAGAAMLRSEIVALSPSDADLAAVQAAGFGVIGVRALAGLDARIVVLQAPRGVATARALVQLRTLLPAGRFDFNHVYSQSGTAAAGRDPADSA